METKNLIRFQKGNIPILIISGHDSKKGLGMINVYQRECIDPACSCSIYTDSYCTEITEAILKNMKVLGKKPYSVICDWHRSYADVNRPRECAYEDPRAKIFYDTWHKKVREYVNELYLKYNQPFLFDIHGARGRGLDVWSIYIGTLDGESIKRIKKTDPNTIQKFRDIINKNGYTTQPGKEGEKELYRGHYSLQAYGSHTKFGINAIQTEIDNSIRFDKDKRTKIGTDLSNIILEYVGLYAKG